VYELKVHLGGNRFRTRRFRGGAREAERALHLFAAEVEAERAAAPVEGTLTDD